MSRRLCSLWLLCALCGCEAKSTAPPAAGAGTPAASKPGPVAASSPEAPAKINDMASEPEKNAAANDAAPATEPERSESTKAVAANDKLQETASSAGKPKDGPKGEPKGEAPKEEEKGLTVQEAFALAQPLMQKQDVAGVVKVLERALPGNPNDANLLLRLAQFNAMLASANPQKQDYSKHQQAGVYARRALKASPQFAENAAVQNMVAPMFYNEACALALEKKSEEAIKALKEAVDIGFKDMALLDKDTDLESLRSLPEYAEFRTQAEATLKARAEAARAALEKEVEDMLASNKPFDFDFDLSDIEGEPIKKADFEGKVLIVDVWGTWCPPCRAEIPHFVELLKNYREAGLEIVGLNSERVKDEDAALKLIKDFHKQNSMNYRCAPVSQEKLREIPEFNAFPTTMFFDRSGKVRARLVGYSDFEKLEIIVKKLLDEKVDNAGG